MYIPYAKQSINKTDINSVKKALRSDFITQGEITEKFEKLICKTVNSKYACVVNSATSGLHLACKLLNLKSNDNVWTSANTFVSTANVIEHCGAKVDFIDINEDGNISIEYLKKKLEETNKKNLPKAIIAVHIAGLSCEVKKLFELKKKYKFKIIEDASHALGATFENLPVGSCKYSDYCVFSFHAIKSITTGEGGCVTLNNKKNHERLCQLRSHGIVRKKNLLKRKNFAKFHWYYEVNEIGFNYRLTDFQSALGISQIKRLKQFILKRSGIAQNYIQNIDKKKFILPSLHVKRESSWHLFVIKAKIKNRLKLYNYLKKKGITSVLHYIPVYMHPYYEKRIKNKKLFIKANEYFQDALSIPIFPNLTIRKQKYVIQVLNNF